MPTIKRPSRVQGMIGSALGKAVEQLARHAKDGRLATIQVKLLKLLASRGYGKAQKILEKLSGAEKSKNNLPVLGSRAAKSFRSHIGLVATPLKCALACESKKAAGNYAK